jgi:hypothetical protein
MDELLMFCVDQIALDGDQGESATVIPTFHRFVPHPFEFRVDSSGTALERLWTFVQEFQSKKTPPSDTTPSSEHLAEIDSKFKARLWKHLLRHTEIILNAGDRLLTTADDKPDASRHSSVSASWDQAKY